MADYTGIIVEDLTEARKNKGYMVMLDEQFLDERLWFVPLKSVRHEK
ncbi:hypothetical protein LJC45_03595 [Alistipes sp. OttesenSCG-928-B03]|nr:hypothetical protein [Alistipes sp. OttesenSCG-928-B03]